MKRFENKVALVTGGASGIGEATVKRLVGEGAKVVIADYNIKNADKLSSELQASGAAVKSVYYSAAELESGEVLIQETLKEYERIDILVNNVGVTDVKRDLNIVSLDIHYFDEIFHINLRSMIYLAQLVIPVMVKQGTGNIVNTASISGITADAIGTLYGASKAGVINLTKYIATQMGKQGIRCNAVAPGLILTPAALANLPQKEQENFLQHNSLNYLGKPEDIAAAIAFLASDDSRYITGQTLIADGGLTIHNPVVTK